MTNHGETTGSFESGETAGYRKGDDGTSCYYHRPAAVGRPDPAEADDLPALPDPTGPHQVTLRSTSELADALPYLLGYRPEDSIVLVALHHSEGRGRFGGRARVGIPPHADDWAAAVRQLAHGLVLGCERRGARPGQLVAYVCQEPAHGETGRQVRDRLAPLVHELRLECGRLDVPVVEALCISDGRFWSYCCHGENCCPPEGVPMSLPGTSVIAAAAAYAGIRVRGSLRELRARLLPVEGIAALEQEAVLDNADPTLTRRMLDDNDRARVVEETLVLAEQIIQRYAGAPPVTGATAEDRSDDDLLTHDEAARLILGLQDRTTRDKAAGEWMEGDEADPALRLWRALARRCVGPYREHAAAPLTLAGWVAWSVGDDVEAREAFAMALGANPEYLFARLLHQAINQGIDPESVRRCLRPHRWSRATGTETEPALPAPEAAPASDPHPASAVPPAPDVLEPALSAPPAPAGSTPGPVTEPVPGTTPAIGQTAGTETGPAAHTTPRTEADSAAVPASTPGADRPTPPARRRRRSHTRPLDEPRPAAPNAQAPGRSARSTAPASRPTADRADVTRPAGRNTGRRAARRTGRPLPTGADSTGAMAGDGNEGT
ncbi:DUF4192 family protein [Streptomyces sp. XM83C]|uniref:DUF4192 domain-containing protein n=1 Tax=Streptomyces sp. XM83C TaxID=2929781 RepID=UPI001FF8C247|nr:DUF4192 domain-containing protein [Streptomyces sp. XM83C]MCK1821775.1 DUF4192 family protein [Streptomyces sp. XM83C]